MGKVKRAALEVGEDGMPKHLIMGLTAEGNGPCDDQDDPHFDHWGCWCGDDTCRVWRWTQSRPTRAVVLLLRTGSLREGWELPARFALGLGTGAGWSLWARFGHGGWKMVA